MTMKLLKFNLRWWKELGLALLLLGSYIYFLLINFRAFVNSLIFMYKIVGINLSQREVFEFKKLLVIALLLALIAGAVLTAFVIMWLKRLRRIRDHQAKEAMEVERAHGVRVPTRWKLDINSLLGIAIAILCGLFVWSCVYGSVIINQLESDMTCIQDKIGVLPVVPSSVGGHQAQSQSLEGYEKQLSEMEDMLQHVSDEFEGQMFLYIHVQIAFVLGAILVLVAIMVKQTRAREQSMGNTMLSEKRKGEKGIGNPTRDR